MKRILAFAMTLCMVFALCACGSQAASKPAEQAAAPAATQAPVEVVQPKDAVVATEEETKASTSEYYNASPADWGTKYEEYVYLGYASDTATAEPFMDSSTQLQYVTNMTFRGLCKYDLIDGVMYPRLATEWYPNDDSTVWTFKLREGVKFHDGTTLDADDVVFSFERSTDGTQVKVPNTLVAGVLDKVEAVDKMTVAFHLNRSVFDFPYMAGQAIWSKEAFESGMENPGYIGAGPYKWAGQEIGVSYTLEAFEDYYEGCPKTHYIQFKVLPEIDSQIAALQVGEIDWMGAVRATDQPVFEADDNIIYRAHGGGTIYFLVWNNRREIAQNKDVTDAVYMAFDKEAANLAMFSGDAALTDNIAGNACSPDYVDIDNPIPFDPEAAKAKLAEAGYGDGKLTLTCMYYAWCKPIAETFQACCSEIGVNVEMKEIDGSVYRALCEEGEYDVTMTYCSTSSIVNYMTDRFYTKEGGGNWWGYEPTEEIAAQFEVLKSQKDLDSMMAESAKLQQLCAADTRYIPFCMAPSRSGYRANLEDYRIAYRGVDADFSTVYKLAE